MRKLKPNDSRLPELQRKERLGVGWGLGVGGVPRSMGVLRNLGFRVWGLGFRVWGLGFGVWGLGFRV